MLTREEAKHLKSGKTAIEYKCKKCGYLWIIEERQPAQIFNRIGDLIYTIGQFFSGPW
jgi:hypothetical protein